MPPRVRPAALTIVAWLFILSGIGSCIEVLVSLVRGHININFGVINLFVGIGLLRLRAGWRTLGLILLWIAIIGSAIVGVLVFANDRGTTSFKMFGVKITDISRGEFFIFLAAFFTLSIWQYRMLIRPDVRRLFIQDPLDALRIRRDDISASPGNPSR